MKKIVLILGLLAMTGCAGSYKPTFPADAATPVNLHVAPVLNQEEIAVQVVVADSSASTAQFGLIGALVGAAIDSAVNNSRAKKAELRAEVLRGAALDYDLVASMSRAVGSADQGVGWAVSKTDRPIATTAQRERVAEIFDSSNVDAVAVLVGNYELTPGIDQVRADISQAIYFRANYKAGKKPKSVTSRFFTYLSPAHPLNYRLYTSGEKEALIEAAKASAAAQAEANPDDANSINKALEKEVEELDESLVIPEHIAIKETWTPELLKSYLDQSASHLAKLIEFDWSESNVPDAKALGPDTFFAVNSMGTNARVKGREVARMDDNVIYRAQNGIMYSVPKP